MKVSILFLLIPLLLGYSSKKGERILVLGDSNGAAPNGWVAQLQMMRPQDTFCNLSIHGNTIGFNNGGRDTLNTLKNIESYLNRAEKELGSIDRILILLGSNDCKAMFDSLQTLVPDHFDRLLTSIELHYVNSCPPILYIAPSPMAADSLLEAKYYGGSQRLSCLVPKLQNVAERHNASFVHLHDSLLPHYPQLHVDGIHLNDAGYIRSAQVINQFLNRIQ